MLTLELPTTPAFAHCAREGHSRGPRICQRALLRGWLLSLQGQNGGPVEGLRDPDPEVGLADSATELPPSSAGVASHHLRPVQIELTWTDITYKVQPVKTQKGAERKSREILHRCSGQLLPRQAVAIMGPSGAGEARPLPRRCQELSLPPVSRPAAKRCHRFSRHHTCGAAVTKLTEHMKGRLV